MQTVGPWFLVEVVFGGQWHVEALAKDVGAIFGGGGHVVHLVVVELVITGHRVAYRMQLVKDGTGAEAIVVAFGGCGFLGIERGGQGVEVVGGQVGWYRLPPVVGVVSSRSLYLFLSIASSDHN